MPLENLIDPNYRLIASIHGIAGLVIFLCGILQFILVKGTKLHKRIGYIYFYSWIVILATGAYIGSPIIVAIVFMGFYLCITGIRLAVLKGQTFKLLDYIIFSIAVLVVLLMITATIFCTINHYITYAIISGFFSLLYATVVALDFYGYVLKKPIFKQNYGGKNWYMNHMLRMNFSFLTAIGAFTAVQNVFGNTVLNFILPALIGFICVNFSKRYFKKKLNIT